MNASVRLATASDRPTIDLAPIGARSIHPEGSD
jgi:hypothetical protein